MRRAVAYILAAVFFATPVVRAGTTIGPDEAPHARAYLEQIQARLVQIESQMTSTTAAADLAAKAIVSGKRFGVRGDAGLASELSNRAGAMLGYDGRTGGAGGSGDVILYVFGLARRDGPGGYALLVRQLDEAARLKASGAVVIGLGSSAQLRSLGLLDEARDTCDSWLNNAAGPLNRKRDLNAMGGVMGGDDDGRAIIPTATVLNAAAAWTFQCELFSAFTRLDKVPVVRKSFEIDTKQRRWLRYGRQRFHHDRWLDPIPPGELGHAYLNGLREVLLDIGTASWRNITRTARRAHHTRAAGGTVWLRAGGRYLPYHVGGQLAADPGVLMPLNHDGSNPALPAPGRRDFVIAIGHSEPAGSWQWGEPELLRQAGRGVSWVVNGYNTQRSDLRRRDILVDLWGPVGDAVVKVNDYDTRLGPVSSVAAEAVLWMITAEMIGQRNDRE